MTTMSVVYPRSPALRYRGVYEQREPSPQDIRHVLSPPFSCTRRPRDGKHSHNGTSCRCGAHVALQHSQKCTALGTGSARYIAPSPVPLHSRYRTGSLALLLTIAEMGAGGRIDQLNQLALNQQEA